MTVRTPHSSFLRKAAMTGVLITLVFAPAYAAEQTAKLPTTTYQGLGMSSDQPIQFESEQLEVHDQDKTAVFTGHVIVRQGTTVLKTDRLVVFYQGSPTGEGPQQVSRLEAKGNVLVTSPTQTASGDNGIFDTAANTIVLTDNVVLTQGDNVIRGPKLQIDINTSQAKMIGAGTRVQMLIAPKSLDTTGTGKTKG